MEQKKKKKKKELFFQIMFTVCYYVYAACTHYGCVVKLENQTFEDIAFLYSLV